MATKYGLKLVSPAVNYCGTCVTENGVTFTNPVQYLDSFFSACVNCQVDYIAVHSYMCYVSDYDSYISLFKKYNKPIWLTEFACWNQDGITETMQDNLMVGMIDFLEREPYIFRYSWFASDRTGSYPYLDIFNSAPGSLTSLGDLYVHFYPIHDSLAYTSVPALIQAENYSTQYGTYIEPTSDTSGFADVGWIDPGDWLEYNINVSTKGVYYIYFRIASTGESSIDVEINNNLATVVSVPITGGYQNWTTLGTTLYLNPGAQKLKLYTPTGLFNLNWLNITQNEMTLVPDADQPMKLYPNPTHSLLHIQLANNQISNHVALFDEMGKIRLQQDFTDGINPILLDLSSLEKGCYIVRITNAKTTTSQLIIKE